MKAGTLVSVVAATCAYVALIVPQCASAKPGYFVLPAERESQLSVKGTRGFQITIDRTAGRVELTASKGGTSAIYIVHAAKSKTDGIEATFPGRGKVSVGFHPRGPARRSPGECGGRASVRQTGIFVGVVKFEGEQGYTRVAVGHARGYVYHHFKQSCKGQKGKGLSTTTIYLTELAKSEGLTTVFTAIKPAAGSPFAGSSSFFVSRFEKRHGMTSVKLAFAKAAEDTFAVAGAPTQPESATVTPPSPFSGTASFHASAGALAKWEGTLAVDLLGIGTIQLTGSQFEPELCLARSCVGGPSP
jgi:hypothetical protein